MKIFNKISLPMYIIIVILLFSLFFYIIFSTMLYSKNTESYKFMLKAVFTTSQSENVQVYIQNNNNQRVDLDKQTLKKIFYYMEQNVKFAKRPNAVADITLHIDSDIFNIYKVNDDVAIVDVDILDKHYCYSFNYSYLWYKLNDFFKN